MPVVAGPENGHENGQGAGIHLLRGQAEVPGAVHHPREDSSNT